MNDNPRLRPARFVLAALVAVVFVLSAPVAGGLRSQLKSSFPRQFVLIVGSIIAVLAIRYRTGYVKSEAAMFHSYMTSWYRPDRSNADCVRLYDGTNTLWFPEQGSPIPVAPKGPVALSPSLS